MAITLCEIQGLYAAVEGYEEEIRELMDEVEKT
jgi:hypothetical protein